MSTKQYGIYYDYTGAGRGPELIAGPFNSQAEAEAYADEESYPLVGDNYFVDVYREPTMNETYEPMSLLKEMLITESDKKKAKKVSRKAAHAVYHRDYIKTKKKPYRKYDPEDYSRGKA